MEKLESAWEVLIVRREEVGTGLQRAVLVYVMHKIPKLIIRDDGHRLSFLLPCKHEEQMRVNLNWKEVQTYRSWDFNPKWDESCGPWAFMPRVAKGTLHHLSLPTQSHPSKKTQTGRSSFYSDWTDLLEINRDIPCFTCICLG